MPFELSRRYARLPRGLRVCLDLVAAALGTTLVLAVFALVGLGPSTFQALTDAWAWHWVVVPGLFAVLAISTAVLGNAAYERFHAWETARLPSVRAFFHNHDLARLVGQSIGMSLRACEADLSDGDARVVRRLALRAEEAWPAIAQGERARKWLAGIGDDRLLAFIRDPARRALSDQQTAVLLELLHPDDLEQVPAFADPKTGALVRERLGRRLGEALRQALKRDFARRGEAAFGLLLDIAGELLNQGAVALPRTAENQVAVARAVSVTLSLDLPVPPTQAAALRAQVEAQAERLDATYRAVRAEGRAAARRDQVMHWSLILVAALVALVGLVLWYVVETGRQATDQRLAAIQAEQLGQQQRLAAYQAEILKALAQQQASEGPTQRLFSSELLAKARELLKHGNPEQQAVAKSALKRYGELDGVGQDFINAADLDRAIQPDERAQARRPENPDTRGNAVITKGYADLNDIADNQKKTIGLPTDTLALIPSGSPYWKITQTRLAVSMATGSPKGTYYRIGQDIAAIAAPWGLDIEVKESRGSLDNIQRINSRENLGFGIVQSDVLGYLKRDSDFNRNIAERLRVIFPFYLEEVHVLARLDIKSLRDLNGKRVAIGEENSGTWLTAMTLFKTSQVERGGPRADGAGLGTGQMLAGEKQPRRAPAGIAAGCSLQKAFPRGQVLGLSTGYRPADAAFGLMGLGAWLVKLVRSGWWMRTSISAPWRASGRTVLNIGVTPRERLGRYSLQLLCSPDGAQRNPCAASRTQKVSATCRGSLDSATLHPGCEPARGRCVFGCSTVASALVRRF